MKSSLHLRLDWCHLCGKRSGPLVAVWYPTEHSKLNTEYVRICALCMSSLTDLLRVGDTAKGKWTGLTEDPAVDILVGKR